MSWLESSRRKRRVLARIFLRTSSVRVSKSSWYSRTLKESKAVLVVEDHMAHGGQKLIPQPRASLGIELFATGPQQVELQKAIGQGHKDHLIDHQGEGPGAKI